MGIFQKPQKHQHLVSEVLVTEVDPATMEVHLSTKAQTQLQPNEQSIQKLSQWKKARKQEKKARATALASRKAQRSRKIDVLVYHRHVNRNGPQNEYCVSPQIVEDKQRVLHEVAGVGWKTAKIAMKGAFKRLGGKPKC